MTIRAKLLWVFFSITMLIVIVGLTFYFQLRSLVAPLTPQSIPQSVEQLAGVINKKDIANQVLYQQLLVEYDLENYVFTKQNQFLQKYYMDESLLSQLLMKAKVFNPTQWPDLEKRYQSIADTQTKIIKQVKLNPPVAVTLINNEKYRLTMADFTSSLTQYLLQPRISTESLVVTVKLAVQHSYRLLLESLNSTLVILLNAILISLILIFFSARAITQPINLLRNNIEQLDVEKLDLPISKKLLRLKGEVGQLARSFAELFFKLRAATVLRDELLLEIQRHKETELELKKTAINLQESNLDLDQFAYAASHDLRAPLRAIESLAKWIEEDSYHLLPEESRKNLDLIKKRAHRLEMLIAGLLEYSRIGRMPKELDTFDLNYVVADVIDNLAPPPNIHVLIDQKLPIMVTSKIQITQVFLNLISNAIKYNNKSEGYINIGCKNVDKFYQFYVKDNGSGIEEKFHEKLFEIFQTLQPRDIIESSGIGLAIVKKIIDKQGGEIWLESVLDRGTTFFFTWPQ